MAVVLTPLAVAPGITMLSVRTPTLPPATHTNIFMLGTRELMLVEPASPYPEEIERIAAWVADYVAQGHVLRGILLTHHHPDHMGGAARLRERLGVPLFAHPRTRALLADAVAIDELLEHEQTLTLDGPTPLTIQAIHTPGHASGHLCFWEPVSRCLVAGDMVAGVGTIVVAPNDGDMQQYLASLEALDALESRTLLPAHGLLIENPRERLRYYVAHRLAREAKVLAAVSAVARVVSLEDVVAQAYAEVPSPVLPLARASTEAHLIKLEREGKVVRRHGGWLREAAV